MILETEKFVEILIKCLDVIYILNVCLLACQI